MKRFGRALAGVIGWALAVCGGMLFLGSAVDFHRTDSPRGPSEGFAVGFFLVVAVAGVTLIRLAWPGLLARIGREILATCTS
jgi:hypothetical protein